ncbi:hypothetical protein CXG81DRAFT_14031 [Caulochytrium protostelioides]|uniref:NADH:ubiquinone reductase (non-electrogenic) n=1 Tax=Caulochytrium protostelioides TaxID=1555241 RepID=A0A4P9X407_9FUNG|nr:FAD/NAD(P)-binding domain-containing protein [Caulochytrium protostelioides]RKO99785.1 hypothetical protein CXG81DRAFT_14031 [Caulochytrium protostelioides]|eukprot:RKO99785.1 hypothetical protein CXG81DRAFT_14031 [Caulochytrium protostelioides]
MPAAQGGPQHDKSHHGFFRRHWTHLVGAALGAGLICFGYEVYSMRHPPAQLPQDPSKPNLVVLGSGWAATALLTDLDTERYNVIVISPRNYFLFTPLLPSCTVGTLELRSIMQPMRYITRFKSREVLFVEGDATDIDPVKKTVTVTDNSEIKGEVSTQTFSYDHLVVATGADNATFGIKGVYENACFLKEAWDARKIRTKLMDCIETAAFPGQTDAEIDRLLHMVVVGGGPTGVEYAAELHDFLKDDLAAWYPELASRVRITLIEALPHVLPMFSKTLIDYTEQTFAENKVAIRNRTMVKEVRQKEIVVQCADKSIEHIPYGLLVWATGNMPRPINRQLIAKIGPSAQNQRRGIVVDECLRVKGAENIWALGDASATSFPPTAQVASRQGRYLASLFNRAAEAQAAADAHHEAQLLSDTERRSRAVVDLQTATDIPPFTHTNLGSLAYIGADRAIADLPSPASLFTSEKTPGWSFGGVATFWFWRSAYLSNLFALRNRVLVSVDWMRNSIFGRDIGRE